MNKRTGQKLDKQNDDTGFSDSQFQIRIIGILNTLTKRFRPLSLYI